MDADRRAISSARPAFTVGGQARAALDSGLLRLAIADSVDGLATCEAEFGNWGATPERPLGHLWFDRQVLDFGADFVVKLGGDTLFDGRIMALEGHFPAMAPPRIVVRADDRLQDLRMTRRSRAFEALTDADLVQRIAQDHGLQADVDLPGPTWPLLVQANESDLAFLRRRLRVADADLVLAEGRLQVSPRGQRSRPAPQLTQGARLHHFHVAADLAHQRTQVTVGGWDVAAKDAATGEATAAALGREANDGDSGPAVLQRALGARAEHVGHRVPGDATAARHEAEAHLRLIARRFLHGRGEADAEPQLRPGGAVDLRGLGPLFDGRYGVTDVLHRFDAAQGLRTAFGVERAWIGRA